MRPHGRGGRSWSLGTETGKFITELKSDSGNKEEIPAGERWKTAEDSMSFERSDNADVLCRKENCACHLQLHYHTGCLCKSEMMEGKWEKGEDEEDRIVIKDSLHALRLHVVLPVLSPTTGGAFSNFLWFLPCHNPMCAVFSTTSSCIHNPDCEWKNRIFRM